MKVLRRAVLLLPLARLLRAHDYDELREKSLAVEKHWDVWIRKLFGCQLRGDTNADTCKPSRAEVDYSAFRKWADAAKKLLGLTDK